MLTIYLRAKNHAGQWRYEKVNTGRGRPVTGLSGPFFIRLKEEGKRWYSWLPLGAESVEEAKKAAERIEKAQEAKAMGLTVAELDEATSSRLSTKVSTFCKEIEANKSRKTWLAYRKSLEYFQQSCRKKTIQDITRTDLLAFKTYLRDEAEMSERSVYNNFLNAMIFLKWCKVRNDIQQKDWPPKPEREPEEYTDAELKRLLNAADPDERLLLNCFLCSGLRSDEMSHLTYGDIDFEHSVWTVRPKNGWSTKTKQSQRDVPVPMWLTKKVHQRKEALNKHNSDWIFPNTLGGPDRKLLKVTKRAAKKAKLAGRVDDHKFRSTAITRWLRAGNTVPDVMSWVGHISPKTILRYAAKVKVRETETRERAEKAFHQFQGVGD